MSTVEAEKSEVAALNAKLSQARSEIKDKDKELNDLRNRVVKLEDKSPVEGLEAQVASLTSDLAAANVSLADVSKQAAKQARDLEAAGPALELVAAINAVKE